MVIRNKVLVHYIDLRSFLRVHIANKTLKHLQLISDIAKGNVVRERPIFLSSEKSRIANEGLGILNCTYDFYLSHLLHLYI